MGAKIMSIGLKGLEGYRVSVEVQVMEGPNRIKIVGLPDASIIESKERIAAALDSLGYPIFHKKIVVNLSPAEQRKNGPLFDLPIAIGILKSTAAIDVKIEEDIGFLGALSLDGRLASVEGMLPAVLAAHKAGIRRLYVPFDQQMPKLDFAEMEMIYASSLMEVLRHLSGGDAPQHDFTKQEPSTFEAINQVDFHHIIGHKKAKHALEIAAAGGHHLLMCGPPGCGKSMLAESFPSMSKEKWLEVLSIYQLSGSAYLRSKQPPFRNPHYSSSSIAMIGGGQNPRPGEISLAHNGVLFLDEMAEFPRKSLEMMRQPLETGTVTISRARSTVTYPSEFTLIGAMNPCPCGYNGSNKRYCTCTKKQISAYQNRLSGPVRDRFDIYLSLKSIELLDPAEGKREASAIVRERVIAARERQYARYGKQVLNGRVPYEGMLKSCPIEKGVTPFIQHHSYKQDWSNRKQIKIIRLAQTIADLNNQTQITIKNIIEASSLSN